MNLHETTDAAVWAEEFAKTFPDCGVDEGTMIGWFANAMMAKADCIARAEAEPETWDEMKTRHALEKAEAVMALEAQGMTQTEAARVLEMRLVDLNNFVKRNGLTWRVVRQGFASRDPESLSPYGVNNPPARECMQ